MQSRTGQSFIFNSIKICEITDFENRRKVSDLPVQVTVLSEYDAAIRFVRSTLAIIKRNLAKRNAVARTRKGN